jgi:hypothetical protein
VNAVKAIWPRRLAKTMRPLLAILVVMALAGCAAPDVPDADKVTIDTNRPDPSFSKIQTGPAVGPDLNATTAAAPRLVEGEWWRIEFDSDFYMHSEVVRVVANASKDGYIFGMPHEGWFKEAIAFHAPAFGDVALNLSYATHNVVFEPVRFPLVAGNTWNTHFAASPMIASVEEADEYTATIRFDSPPNQDPSKPATDLIGLTGDFGMRIKYDARQHEVVEMTSGIGSWRVVEHGYGFEGWVTVPRGEHTAIDYGTFWPAEGKEPMRTRTVDVSGGFNRLTMMHVIFPFSPGQYEIRSKTPAGEQFITTGDGADGKITVKFYEASSPDGTWQQTDNVLGVAATYSMGIAYHQFDIRLPDGARRADHDHAVLR